jgi:hypothetical protein
MTKRFFPFKLVTNQQETAMRWMKPDSPTPALVAETVGDSPTTDQQLADAFNANNAIMAYVLGLSNSTLPALTTPPEWYTTFMTKFSDAKVHAMAWTNTIAPGLVAIPTGIVNYAFTFNINMLNINSALTVLQTNPQDQPAQRAVLTGLQALLSGFSLQLKNAQQFQTNITDFASNLTADVAIMQQASTDATRTVGYDQTQVTKLTTDIQALQDEISTWQKVVTGAAIGAGVAFWAGAVIGIFSLGIGLAFGILGAVAGIALLIAGEVKIQQLSAKIAQDQVDIRGINAEIALLNTMINNLKTVITLANAAGQQIALVLAAWQAMEADITTVIGDLNAAETDLSGLNIASLQHDLTQANTDWQALSRFCTTIAGIQYLTATPATVNLPTSAAAAAA